MENTIQLYVVRNADGEYHRSRGYSGYGKCWVAELKQAKVYAKIGVAKSQITYWVTNYPDYGIPDLVPLNATLGEPIDQGDRIEKHLKRKALEVAKNQLYDTQRKFDIAKREMERTKREHVKLNYDKATRALKNAENEVKRIKNS